MIEILTTGAPNSVQDLGRLGHLSSGISRCGAMDRLALGLGNILLGNPADAAGLEIALFPFRLRFRHAASFAVTGADCGATLDDQPLPPVWTRGAKAGQILALAAPRRGARAYVTVAGGIAVPLVMGSRSTDLKGGFGGLEGRGLRRGDVLETGEAENDGAVGAGFGAAMPSARQASDRDPSDAIQLRVVEAAEYEAFDAASREAFETADWTVCTEANRAGYRLAGPALALDRPLDLFSHGIVPGIVQVPANGQPIVQLADANTCGGYPKIAAVIEPDLWRLAQAPVGTRLRFTRIDGETAIEAHRAEAVWLDDLRTAVVVQRRRRMS